MTEPQVLVEVRDLVKSFGRVQVLEGLSFDVRAGETLCILGGSGGGKSTLLKCLIGAHPVTAGTIRYGADDLAAASGAGLDRIRRGFGVMFQGGALLNSMTVGENVALPLRYHTRLDVDTMSTVVKLKLMQVDMLHAEDRMPSAISGGMQKRAAIARALALDPKILFYDEPSAGLDPIATTRIDQLINGLKHSMGMTNVVVTHVMESVERIADRVVFLKDGRIHFDGGLDAFKRSDDPAIRRFLDAEVEDEPSDDQAFYEQLLREPRPRGAGPIEWLGWLGRRATQRLGGAVGFLRTLAGMWDLLRTTCVLAVTTMLGGSRARTRLRGQLGPLLEEVGNRSLGIIALVSVLMGAILVFQTGEVLAAYGQIKKAPSMVALSMTRELGPLMTAFIMTARIGASFTAVLAAMTLDEEVLALETMAIQPAGYLIVPRLLAMLVMMPCLVVISYFAGILGGALVAGLEYDLGLGYYLSESMLALTRTDVLFGLVKGSVFGMLTTVICCYFGMNARGGPMGLGRYTTTAVVTSMVVIVVSDSVLTSFFVNYKQLLEGWFG